MARFVLAAFIIAHKLTLVQSPNRSYVRVYMKSTSTPLAFLSLTNGRLLWQWVTSLRRKWRSIMPPSSYVRLVRESITSLPCLDRKGYRGHCRRRSQLGADSTWILGASGSLFSYSWGLTRSHRRSKRSTTNRFSRRRHGLILRKRVFFFSLLRLVPGSLFPSVSWCRKYGIRILLDLHALPGSQNGWVCTLKFISLRY